jgi:hypothetical protein
MSEESKWANANCVEKLKKQPDFYAKKDEVKFTY